MVLYEYSSLNDMRYMLFTHPLYILKELFHGVYVVLTTVQTLNIDCTNLLISGTKSYAVNWYQPVVAI